MKKEELTALGLTDEQCNKIFEINGKDIENAKSAGKAEIQTVADGLKNQLKDATEKLKSFEGIDPSKLQSEIQTLNTQMAQQKVEFEAKIADRDFNDLLSKEITACGGKNTKAISALLDMDSLKASKNQANDVKTALETIKKENDYLFTSEEPIKNPTASTNGEKISSTDELVAKARAIMGLEPKK